MSSHLLVSFVLPSPQQQQPHNPLPNPSLPGRNTSTTIALGRKPFPYPPSSHQPRVCPLRRNQGGKKAGGQKTHAYTSELYSRGIIIRGKSLLPPPL
ncbi:hypothetical protein VTJ04DRAFT_6537 [Mycothermus thermophilus]|uniref:uncharacterized protein n=1 Tax=Humicola insolens TaxID=85995 RepID=UPI0037420C2C